MDDRAFKRLLWILCAAFGACAGLGYAGFATPHLVWDDIEYYKNFLESPVLSSLAPFNFNVNFWRPLATASFMLPWNLAPALGGMGPAILASKLGGCAILGAAVALACAAAVAGSALDPGKRWKAVASIALLALLIGASPIFAEPALWLSSRGDLLLCLLLPAAMLAASNPQTSGLAPLLLGLCLGFSKETGFMWCMALSLLCARDERLNRWALGFGLAAVANLVLWKFAMVAAHPQMAPPMAAASSGGAWSLSASEDAFKRHQETWDMALSFLESMGRDAWDLFAHWSDPCALHPEGPGSRACKALGALTASGCVAALAWQAKRDPKGGTPGMSLDWAFASAGAAMLLVNGVFIATEIHPWEAAIFSIQRDRYLAPILIVWAILAAKAVVRSPGRRSKTAFAGLALTIAAGIPDAWQARATWGDELSLWRSCSAESPPSKFAQVNLAYELYARGDLPAAQSVAAAYIKQSPDSEPSCELWAIAEKGSSVDPGLRADIERRKALYPTCMPFIEPPHYPGLD